MSIFGQMDAANVSTNPFHVEEGTYSAQVTKAEYRDKQDGSRSLFIEYTITNEESAYKGDKVQQSFSLMDPKMTEEDFLLLPDEEKKKIRRTNASIKKTLCGDSPSRQGLGVAVDDLNDPEWKPSVVIGTDVNIGVRNNGNNYVNVSWVNLAD